MTVSGRDSKPWRDAREWMERVDAIGELRVVRGVDWQTGIAEITEMLDHSEGSPCVLFDDIPGYPSGHRVIVNCSGTPTRQAVTLNLPHAEGNHAGLFGFWRTAHRDVAPLEPRFVDDGPVFENTQLGAEIDLESFPVPVWHPKDGGRYIGTASMNILRDPESDWINVGTYRNQLFASDELGLWISPGKHGRMIRERHVAAGEPFPIVVVVGADPLLFMASAAPIPYGVSEFAWAGGVRGEPIDLVRGPSTGLPFPATAEIAIEGWVDPAAEMHEEGPYGEFHGYYGFGEGKTRVIKVSAVHHRDNPILLGCPQGKPPHEDNRFLAYLRATQIEHELEAAGVHGVTGVWCPPETAERFLIVIAIDQAYPGHATQALMVGGQTSGAAYMNRMVVVVDSDIEITNLNDVLWAMTTRCDPARDVRIVERAWSGPLDTAIQPEERGFNSRLLIDATRPWEWKDRFAEPVVTPEMAAHSRAKWGWILDPSASDPRAKDA